MMREGFLRSDTPQSDKLRGRGDQLSLLSPPGLVLNLPNFHSSAGRPGGRGKAGVAIWESVISLSLSQLDLFPSPGCFSSLTLLTFFQLLLLFFTFLFLILCPPPFFPAQCPHPFLLFSFLSHLVWFSLPSTLLLSCPFFPFSNIVTHFLARLSVTVPSSFSFFVSSSSFLLFFPPFPSFSLIFFFFSFFSHLIFYFLAPSLHTTCTLYLSFKDFPLSAFITLTGL